MKYQGKQRAVTPLKGLYQPKWLEQQNARIAKQLEVEELAAAKEAADDGTITEIIDPSDIESKFGVTDQQIDRSPIWIFEYQASEEIAHFMQGISDEEFAAILKQVSPPDLIRITLVGPSSHPSKVDVILIKSKENGDYIVVIRQTYLSEFSVRTATQLAIQCLIIRCFFKQRYVEVLTKHQQRALRRHGQISSDSPRIINVAWDAPTPKVIYEQHIREAAEREAARRCLHEVHGHPRHLRSGKTVWVRGHQRGDPNIERKTIINHTGSKRDG